MANGEKLDWLGLDLWQFDEAGKVILETSFGRFAFAFDEIDSARIDPAEIFARESARQN